MKKLIMAFMLILLVLGSMVPEINAYADYDTKLTQIDGKYTISINYIFDKLGAKVSLENSSYTITKGKNTIILNVGSDYAIVNQEEVEMDIPVTYSEVSMKFIEKYDTLFGNNVIWDGKTYTVSIVKTEAPVKSNVSFGMVTDIGGLGDKYYNDWAWSGLIKAGKELGSEPLVIQSRSQEDYLINMIKMTRKADLTIGIGFLMENAMKAAANLYQDKKFGIIDTVIDAPNVMSITYKENEGSFLVGVIAGMTTKTNTVGFIGGMDIPIIKEYEIGFRAGVASVNPDAKVLISYTGNFIDPDSGSETALSQHNQKADVIYHASGACGIGIIWAADQYDFWAIGMDSDQAIFSKKNKVLCSMVKKVDVATHYLAKSLAEGTFRGGYEKCMGLLEDGVGYSDYGKNVSDKAAKVAEKYKEKIVKGEIIVPSTEEELSAFNPVKLK